MSLFRGVSAIFVFVVALFTLALALYGIFAIWAYAAQTHQPIDLLSLAAAVGACIIGVLFLVISRALDPEHGPVRSYRKRPRKARPQV
jgi:hypothetical protein